MALAHPCYSRLGFYPESREIHPTGLTRLYINAIRPILPKGATLPHNGKIMFGWKRHKAVSTATEAVAPFVRAFEAIGGLPDGFWRDPYVVGFLSGCIAIFAKMATGWKLSGRDLGYVVVEVLDNISSGSGTEIATFGNDCLHAQDPEYARGIRNAEKVISVVYGLGDYTDDPDIQAARRDALNPSAPASFIAPFGNQGTDVGGALLDRLYYREIQERFQKH